MRKSIAMTLALLLSACGIACTPEGTPPDETSTTTTVEVTTTEASTTSTTVPGPVPLWHDEFTEGLDPYWRVYDNTYGSGGHILSGNSPDAVDVHDGLLQMTIARIPTHGLPFQGSIIGTRDTGHYFPRYGKWEARMKLIGGQGSWPAFWLRHRNGSSVGEVDIMERFFAQNPTSVIATLHLNNVSNVSKKAVAFDDTQFHVWAVEIRPDPSGVRFTFSQDGVVFHSYVDTNAGWTSAPADATWDIAIDSWVGGDWIGSPDGPLGTLGNGRTVPTAGLYLTPLPSTMYVDWVRVWP